MMTLRSDRAGFALPMAVLVIGFMTAGVVAAFARTTSEVRVVDNERAQTTAFALAQAGLERYIARGRTTPTDTTMSLAGGVAQVTATQMRAATAVNDTSIWMIRSEGRTTAAGLAIPQGKRTVVVFAYRLRGRMQVMSAWTSLSGLIKNGSSGQITGDNACGNDTLPGVALPTGTYTQMGAGTPLEGNPPLYEMGTQAAMASQLKINWASISNPVAPALTADVVVCFPGTVGYDSRWGPCSSFPTTTQFADTSYWPTIVVNGSVTLSNSGRGTLIVTGQLVMDGTRNWDGIILVGDAIIDNGDGDIGGAVVTGLNVLKGEAVSQSAKANGTKDYQYDSCKVQRAADAHMRLSQIPNSWADNWATW